MDNKDELVLYLNSLSCQILNLKTVVNIGQINLERGKSFIQQLSFAKDMTFVIFINKIQQHLPWS